MKNEVKMFVGIIIGSVIGFVLGACWVNTSIKNKELDEASKKYFKNKKVSND